MKKWLRLIVGTMLCVCLIFLCSACMVEAEVPNRPQDSTVLDETKSLSETTIATIDSQNKNWSMTDEQLQVAVYMTDQLSTDMESLANEVFRKWQVGFEQTNNGVLLLIALEDRQFRIETSDKAATILTDVTSKRILEGAKSFFKDENYNDGVLYIVEAIGDQFYGTNQAQERIEELEEDDEEIFLLGIVVIFIFIVLLLIPKGRGGGGRGKRNGGNDLLLWLLLNSSSNSSNHHSSNSSGFGGNNWSGGGGGGGGASSGW